MDEQRTHAYRQQLGKRIRIERRRQKLSLRRLGAMTNVSYPYLSLIEQGKTAVSIDVLLKVADGLGVSVSTLFAFEEEFGFRYVSAGRRKTKLPEDLWYIS